MTVRNDYRIEIENEIEIEPEPLYNHNDKRTTGDDNGGEDEEMHPGGVIWTTSTISRAVSLCLSARLDRSTAREIAFAVIWDHAPAG